MQGDTAENDDSVGVPHADSQVAFLGAEASFERSRGIGQGPDLQHLAGPVGLEQLHRPGLAALLGRTDTVSDRGQCLVKTIRLGQEPTAEVVRQLAFELMSRATGRDIITELVQQLGFGDILDHVLATTGITTVMMPYASSLFATRAPGDRPLVVPAGSANFAFLGQFTEIPGDVVFTVEYSVHGAMDAVYTLLGVDRPIPPIFRGILDPPTARNALETTLSGKTGSA